MLDIKGKCDFIKEDFIGFYTLKKMKALTGAEHTKKYQRYHDFKYPPDSRMQTEMASCHQAALYQLLCKQL